MFWGGLVDDGAKAGNLFRSWGDARDRVCDEISIPSKSKVKCKMWPVGMGFCGGENWKCFLVAGDAAEFSNRL